MNIVLILSGGTGTRMQTEIPKQYLTVKGKTIISYCLQTFVESDYIDVIWIVADSLWQQRITEDFQSNHMDMSKLKGFSNPGHTRQLSIVNGLKDIKKAFDCSNVRLMIHDAARPMLNVAHISTYFQAMEGHDGVMPVLPMKDTVYMSEDGKEISSLLNRSQVFAGQSPEIFIFDKYYEACMSLMPDEIMQINGSTEPAVRGGMDILLVPGDEKNFKITTARDFEYFIKEIG